MSSLARRSFASRCGALSLFLVSIAATPGAWSAATGTWTPAGSMTTDRDGHTVTTLPSGLILVAGGSGSLGYLASAEVYNPGSGMWSLVNSMATSRRDHTATRLADGRVLVAGGINSGASTGMKSAELFDPGTGLWSSAGSMLTGRWLHTATLLGNGKVLVAGGFQSFAVGELSSAELYEPSSNSWSSAGSMATGRYWHAATLLLDGRVLVTGGYSDSAASTLVGAELYDPIANTFSPAADMGVDRNLHSATLLADGRVLVAGGNSTSAASALAEAELYDPATNTWSAAGSMGTARAAHAAVRLDDGRVVVAGGGGDCFYLASSELYDPGTSTWSPTGSLSVDRAGPVQAALLGGGKVLVPGGFTSTSGMTAVVDLYDVNVVPPRPPTAVVAAAGDETAVVSWTPPAADANAVLEYVVTECPDGYIFKVPASEAGAVLSGLFNDETVTVTVVTRKAFGSSPPSLPSNPVTPAAGSPTPEAASGSVSSAGGTITTDTGGTGPTATDTVETSVGVPATAGGGSVTIAETAITVPAPNGFVLLGQQVEITSDAATTAANPLVLVFTLDESIVSGQTPASIQIFRSEGGGSSILVPDCTGAPGTASPDPCVSSRAYVNVTDIQITVLTSTASIWNMAVAVGACPPGEVGVLQFTSASAIQWSRTPDASLWNTYRGSIPIGFLGSRPPGAVYDQTCFESGDGGGNGATTAVDAAAPALGAAFYYLVDGEGACGEGVLGRDSSGAIIPNTSACPTPP